MNYINEEICVIFIIILFKIIYNNNFHNLQLNNSKDDITCNCTEHTTICILKNSFLNYDSISKQSLTNLSDSQKFLSEVKSFFKYFYRIHDTYLNRKLVSKLFNSLFDVSISLKFGSSNDINREEKFINLEAPLNSSILSKTLKKGSQIKQLILSSKYFNPLNPCIHISFSANTVTIDCYCIKLDDLNFLLELWPGLILRLKHLNFYDEYCNVDKIQRFLSNCGRCPPFCKLSFSKVVIHIGIDEIYKYIFKESYKNISKLKHLIDSLSKIYDVGLENISYEDLFINRRDYFNQYFERWRDGYNEAKLEFERALKYSRIECYLDDFFNNKSDGFNQTIAELKLKEFKFYADKIDMDRFIYDNLKRSYQDFGQFQYFDKRDKGEIQTVDNKGYVEIKSTIEENNISLIRSIKVGRRGEIKEEEWSSNSKFRRCRVIYRSGFCEEYSIHEDSCFGIRKVVYPGGLQFSDEAFDYYMIWNKRGWIK